MRFTISSNSFNLSCSGLDPTEDTESCGGKNNGEGDEMCCSGLDPTEDTERVRASSRARA